MIYTYDDIVLLRNAVLRKHIVHGISVHFLQVEQELQTYVIAGLDPKETVNRIECECDVVEEAARKAEPNQRGGVINWLRPDDDFYKAFK